MITALAVLFAGLLHAVWNALATAVPDRYAAFAVIGLASAAACLPIALGRVPDRPSWPFLLASVALHVVYTCLLIRSYRLGDFSQAYPLARGSAPLLVAVAAAVLGERLGAVQLAGLLAVCGGLIVLALANGRSAAASVPAVSAALLTGAAIASYTVVDGLGVRRAGGSLAYTSWLFLLEGIAIVAVLLAVRGRALLPAMRERWAVSATGGIVSLLAYGIVVWAQTRSRLAEVAALRETGVLWGALIGVVFFAERLGPRRIAAAAAIALGVVLLNGHHT